MPGFDLCLLASSAHSIHTYGTFGLWGSLLAGGDVITTTGTTGTEEATTEVFTSILLISIFIIFRRTKSTAELPWRTGCSWMCGTRTIFKRSPFPLQHLHYYRTHRHHYVLTLSVILLSFCKYNKELSAGLFHFPVFGYDVMSISI